MDQRDFDSGTANPGARAAWVDPRAVTLACGAAALGLPGLLLPPPWSALGGLTAALLGLGACWRTVGGGRTGAVAGWMVGTTALAPAAAPALVQAAWARFERPAGAPVGTGVELGDVLASSLAWTGAATLTATILLPLGCAALLAASPRRTAAAPTRVSRVVPFLVLLQLILWAVAEGAALGELNESLRGLSTSLRGAQAATAGPDGARGVLVALGLFRLGTVGIALVACAQALRAPVAPVSAWASAGGFALLSVGAGSPSITFGLAAALGPVHAIPAWQQGGAVGAESVQALYRLLPTVGAAGVAFAVVQLAVLGALAAAARWAWRHTKGDGDRPAPQGASAGT